ncbi:H-NS family nucleoid-associated regulatory protein [Burkholderia theae]|uniref:H-NS histone family protein n=1 Tax=Burkholderia theae TaxID=3143496 RepID=UPI003AFB7015
MESIIVSTYAELLSQFDRLKQEIENAREREKERFLQQLITLLERNGVSLIDLISYWKNAPATAKTTVKPKYFDPATGKTWAGRGREPEWIRGKDRRDFLIDWQ